MPPRSQRGAPDPQRSLLRALEQHHHSLAAALDPGTASTILDRLLHLRLLGDLEIEPDHLAAIPEVLEAYTITGSGDMWCRVVSRSNSDLQRVIDTVVGFEGIVRTSTVMALATQVPFRVLPLVASGAITGPTSTP